MKNRNNIARHMNSVNKSGYHKDLKMEFKKDNTLGIEEGLEDFNKSIEEKSIEGIPYDLNINSCSDEKEN